MFAPSAKRAICVAAEVLGINVGFNCFSNGSTSAIALWGRYGAAGASTAAALRSVTSFSGSGGSGVIGGSGSGGIVGGGGVIGGGGGGVIGGGGSGGSGGPSSSSSSSSSGSGASTQREPETPLLHSIRNRILIRGGPLSVAEYMAEALTNPLGGYYTRARGSETGNTSTSTSTSNVGGSGGGGTSTRTGASASTSASTSTSTADAVFGARGDFVTSPEVSQMFGEMVAVWALVAWDKLGRPSALRVAELGPGRGTLAADLVRAAGSFPDFARALSLELVELSPGLRAAQRAALGCVGGGGAAAAASDEGGTGAGATAPAAAAAAAGSAAGAAAETAVTRLAGGGVETRVTWRGALDEIPVEGPPCIYIAHEFFDALPVHQFVRDARGRGWLEKLVDVAPDDAPGPHHLQFVLSPGPTPAAALLVPRRLAALPEAERGSIDAVEISAQGMACAERLAQRVGAHGGAALIIDYGRAGPPYKDSLMAIRAHSGAHPLSLPGAADLSAWVDFGALRLAAEGAGAAAGVEVHGPVSQARLLLSLGIQARAGALAAECATAEQAAALQAAYDRLVGTGEGGMGATYQALAIVSDGLGAPVGFEQQDEEGSSG